MKIGIIAPINFLNKYCITDVQYCLPKLLLESKIYRDFYQTREKLGDTIILDCREPIWKRKPEDFKVIGEALKIIKPSVVVGPSYMFNAKATAEIHEKFIQEFRHIHTVGCLEGTSEKEIRGYFDRPMAIPSHMYRYALRARWTSETIFIENHLNLGELDGRDGTLVTSLPIRLGLQGRLLSDCLPSPPTLTFYEEEDKYPQITMKNVQETLEYYR